MHHLLDLDIDNGLAGFPVCLRQLQILPAQLWILLGQEEDQSILQLASRALSS